MYGHPRTISNGDVKIYLRSSLTGSATLSEQRRVWKFKSVLSLNGVLPTLYLQECPRKQFKGLNRFRKRDVLKRYSLAFLLSLLSRFFCLDSLFWHGLASLNLVISTEHHYSAQIDFDMQEFKLFLFSHALRYHHVFGIKWKKRKCPW